MRASRTGLSRMILRVSRESQLARTTRTKSSSYELLRYQPLLLLAGISTHRLQSFVESETASRRVANVWNQVSSLAWIMALNPSPATGRWLHRLLELTGWRRPVLVPPHVAADAALGLAGTGFRGASILELARAGGRVNVIVEVALQHLEDAKAPRDSQ